MSSYQEHLDWLTREIEKASTECNLLFAERDGFIDALHLSVPAPLCAAKRMRERYIMGFEQGKVKLQMEALCEESRSS